jgi:DNA-binding transcriptional LysR family regulator
VAFAAPWVIPCQDRAKETTSYRPVTSFAIRSAASFDSAPVVRSIAFSLNPWRLRLLGLLDTLGTVRAVAQSLHLSPSTVSQQLAVLETETRSRLLERTGRRVRLSRAGVLLARRGREILDRMEEAEAELRALNDEPIGTVRLGVFQSAIHTLAVPAAARLADSHPHLHVELVESEPHESGPSLRTGELDVIVTTTEVDLAACAGEPWACDRPGSRTGRARTLGCRLRVGRSDRRVVRAPALPGPH